MIHDYEVLCQTAMDYGQEHIFRFWDQLSASEQSALLQDVSEIDFPLMQRLIETWVLQEPPAEHFENIAPVKMHTLTEEATAAWEAGEEALRAGRVGIFLVAGGQGTRLGFPGPKGAYPIGPITGKSLFHYHADKIQNLQRRYSCTLPWYIMVSLINHAATEAFFKEHDYFGLGAENVFFFTQRMMPCVDEAGKFILDSPSRLAMNPNGHGGCLPAMVENGVVDDARKRGIDMLSYFQVDNWALKIADPRFIGYHVLGNGEMSSKNHRKNKPREAVGVHCLCDGEYRVIEYSELDIYPQLLENDAAGELLYNAGNPAIHILSLDFVEQVYRRFDQFPWHRAHKKIPYVDDQGSQVTPEASNGYKFETFVFDALRFIQHPPIAVEIAREGEYTPIKAFEGDNSVVAARASMNSFWGKWLDAAGNPVPRDVAGNCAIDLEISPAYALTLDEFLEKTQGQAWPVDQPLAIDADGQCRTGSA